MRNGITENGVGEEIGFCFSPLFLHSAMLRLAAFGSGPHGTFSTTHEISGSSLVVATFVASRAVNEPSYS